MSQLPLKLYSIDFNGHYPVGAVAVVQAACKVSALIAFQAKLAIVEPYLVEENSDLTTQAVTELPFGADSCYILLNGEY